MRYFILILMAIMSVSICTAGGYTHSEAMRHVPKIETYKLKKEKKERKLTGMQIAKIVIGGLIVLMLIGAAIQDVVVFSILVLLFYCFGISAMMFYPKVKKETIIISIFSGLFISLIGIVLTQQIDPTTFYIWGPTWIAFGGIAILFLIIFLLSTKIKKTNS